MANCLTNKKRVLVRRLLKSRCRCDISKEVRIDKDTRNELGRLHPYNEAYALTKRYIENLEDGIKTGEWYHRCYTPQGAKIDRHKILNILKKLAIEEIENGKPCIF
jgi:hypothetical protein